MILFSTEKDLSAEQLVAWIVKNSLSVILYKGKWLEVHYHEALHKD